MTWTVQLGPYHLSTLNSAHELLEIYEQRGQETLARLFITSYFQKEVEQEKAEQIPPITVFYSMAELYESQGKYTQAELFYQRVLTLQARNLGFNHPDIITSMNTLAIIYAKQRKYERAEHLLQDVLAIQLQVLGSKHPDTAFSLSNLGAVYYNLQKYEQATQFYLRALQIWELKQDDWRAEIAKTNLHLAGMHESRGDLENVEPILQKVLALVQEGIPDQHDAAAIFGSVRTEITKAQHTTEIFHLSLEGYLHRCL